MAQHFYMNKYKGKCPKHERQVSRKSSPVSFSEEGPNECNGDIILTNRGFQLYGTWSKTKLLKLLTNRLKQCITYVQLHPSTKISYDIKNERLRTIISKGLYSYTVLKKLQEKEMPMYSILKAMKLGLISLNCCELCYFKDFNVDFFALEFNIMQPHKFDDELIINLKPIGLSDLECWNVIIYGVMHQTSNILYYLMLSGIDVPGILSWQSVINEPSPEILRFLEYLEIGKRILRLVKEYGIDEETEQMLIEMGFNEMKEQFIIVKEIECDTKLSEVEVAVCGISDSKTTSSSIPTPTYYQQDTCKCYLLTENMTVDEMTAQRNDYLRQKVMVPLAWAMARGLKLKPTNAVHFISYQLLHWIYHIDEAKKDSVEQAIALATIKMDHKYVEKRRLEEEQMRKLKEEESLKNTVCKGGHRQKYFTCITEPLEQDEVCKFPELCSSCKLNACKFPELCSSCKLNACKFPELCSSCKLNVCKFPELCSSCKINVSNKSI